MSASNRGRDRREYRPVSGRSRSPAGPPVKRRSYTPPMKRKASPPREREIVRRRKISKSPVGSRGGSQHRGYAGSPPPSDSRLRTGSTSDRFRERVFDEDKERAVPQFRGPEAPLDFDVNELKKFTVQIVRKPHSNNEQGSSRSISNQDDIAPVRRYGEGSRPSFSRGEEARGPPPPRPNKEEYRRVINVDAARHPPGRERERSRERRYSPGYEDSRRYFSERERSPYETKHRSPPPRVEYVEHRDKTRDRPPEDLRRDLDGRRREDRRYSPARQSYERESDLRTRIIEKRTEPVEREQSSGRRYEGERHGHPQHSPPPRDRRRPASAERYEGSRGSRSEHWEREKDRDGGERRRHPGSHERQDKYEERREYEPKKFYKNHDEFIPPPVRGRGGPPMHRGGPPMMRGRGMPRGINRGFRGGMMGGMPRGMPRPPFHGMGIRGFPPRFFPPF